LGRKTRNPSFVEIDFLTPEAFFQVHGPVLIGAFRESAFLLKGEEKILTQ